MQNFLFNEVENLDVAEMSAEDLILDEITNEVKGIKTQTG